MGTHASRLRRFAWLAGAVLALYVGVQVYLAGTRDLPPPPVAPSVVFHEGAARAQRIAADAHHVTTRSWSVDYDQIVANQDQTVFELDGVHKGVIYRNGKPYLRVRAKHLTINTLTRDFTARGPLHVESVAKHPPRTFDTTDATWNDTTQRLSFPNRTTISSGADAPLYVNRLTFDLKTGQLTLRDVAGSVRFK